MRHVAEREERARSRTHPQLDAVLVEKHGEVGQSARSYDVDARVPRVCRDAPQRQGEVLLAKGRDREQGFEEPAYAALDGALVRDVAVLDRARVEEDARPSVRDLYARALGELLDEAEERDLVGAQARVVVVGADAVDANWPAREEREDEAVTEAGVPCKVEHARRRRRGRRGSGRRWEALSGPAGCASVPVSVCAVPVSPVPVLPLTWEQLQLRGERKGERADGGEEAHPRTPPELPRSLCWVEAAGV